ncbi:hypothetical protein NIES4101_25310 (plasmid) [Calothrix sp. NIES-4101]|nr:hypothetical protein NIES4101_25310 [Calothrix sp. NIES-4101]
MKPKSNKRSLPVDSSYEAGSRNNSSRKSDGTLGNCELSSSQKKTESEESQVNHYYQVNMKNPAEFEIESSSTSEKSDDIEREDLAEETAKAIVSSKSVIFGALISLLAIFGMGILLKSSCGGSMSLKLVPPELQLNTGNCTQVETTPQQSLSKN